MTLFIVSRESPDALPTLSVYVDGKKVAASQLSLAAALCLIAELAEATRP